MLKWIQISMKENKLFYLQKIIFIVSVFSCAGLLILLNIASPDNAPPVLLLGMFILLYGAVFGFVSVIFAFSRGFNELIFPNRLRRKRYNLRKAYSYMAIISCVPVFILAIQSIKPISVFEALLILALTFLACFIVYKK